MEKKLIDLYRGWARKGRILYPQNHTTNGLCERIPYKYYNDWTLFTPTEKDRTELEDEGKDVAYWASDLPRGHKRQTYAFTPLRQTIVLFICAMHNEL